MPYVKLRASARQTVGIRVKEYSEIAVKLNIARPNYYTNYSLNVVK